MSRVVAEGLTRTCSGVTRAVLDALDLELPSGTLAVVMGPSGSGKTTLLLTLAGFERPEGGTVRAEVDGHAETDPAKLEWPHLAFLPQSLGLVPDLTVRDNVGLPVRLAGHAVDDGVVEEALDRLGSAQLVDRLPLMCSLGEQQRVALARASVLRPQILLADEPTAHQDARSTQRCLDELRACTDAGGVVLAATHDPDVLAVADVAYELHEGRLTARA